MLKVLHISDLHVDYQYAVGTEGDCGNPQCCRTPGNYEEIVGEPKLRTKVSDFGLKFRPLPHPWTSLALVPCRKEGGNQALSEKATLGLYHFCFCP